MVKKTIDSETFEIGALLAVSGGMMDAYSYLYRGHVFANAQTGNMLLLGVNICKGNFSLAIRYFFPVFSFFIGILLAEFINHRVNLFNLRNNTTHHWKIQCLVIEIILLTSAGFMPCSANFIANNLISLACGMQVEAFRKILGNATATTMCIGNLRSGAENFFDFLVYKDKSSLKKALLYFLIIVFFVAGAVINSLAIEVLKEKSIMLSSLVLISVAVILHIRNRNIIE